MVELAGALALLGGSAFLVIGGIGVLRLRDFYSRTHAASLTDTAGAWLVLLGLLLHSEPGIVSVKLVLIAGVLFVTSPTAAHALVKAAYSRGVRVEDAPRGDGVSA